MNLSERFQWSSGDKLKLMSSSSIRIRRSQSSLMLAVWISRLVAIRWPKLKDHCFNSFSLDTRPTNWLMTVASSLIGTRKLSHTWLTSWEAKRSTCRRTWTRTWRFDFTTSSSTGRLTWGRSARWPSLFQISRESLVKCWRRRHSLNRPNHNTVCKCGRR